MKKIIIAVFIVIATLGIAAGTTAKKAFLSTLKITRKNNAEAINSLPFFLTNALISFKFNQNSISSLIKIFSENHLNVLSNIEEETK